MAHRVAHRRGAAKAAVENGLAPAAMVGSEPCLASLNSYERFTSCILIYVSCSTYPWCHAWLAGRAGLLHVMYAPPSDLLCTPDHDCSFRVSQRPSLQQVSSLWLGEVVFSSQQQWRSYVENVA